MGDIDEFLIQKELLIDDIDSGKIGYLETIRRSQVLWSLIPHTTTISTYRLNDLIKEKFKDDPEWVEPKK